MFCLRESFWYFGASLTTVVVLKRATVVSRIKLASNNKIFYKMQNEVKNSKTELIKYF